MGRLSALCSRAQIGGATNVLISWQLTIRNFDKFQPEYESLNVVMSSLVVTLCCRNPDIHQQFLWCCSRVQLNAAAGIRGGGMSGRRVQISIQGSSAATCRCRRGLRWLAKEGLTMEGLLIGFSAPARGRSINSEPQVSSFTTPERPSSILATYYKPSSPGILRHISLWASPVHIK